MTFRFTFFAGLFIGSLTSPTFSQNPGNIGAANLTAWFKPDALPLGNATSWPTTLSSIGGVTLTDAFAPFPQVTQTPPGNISNYNKTLFFNNNGPTSLQLLSNPVAGINLMQNNITGGQGTFFAAYYLPSGSPTSGTLLQWNNVPNGFSVRNTGVLGQVSIGNQSGVSTNAGRTYSEGYVPTVISVRGNRSTATSLNVFDNDFLSNNSVAAQSTGSQGVYIGYSPGNSTSGYNGYIHEYIFYNTNLTDAQMRRVHSYLAIKYGATLDNNGGGVQGDYINSSGTVIWDASLNPSYHNNVIGIMRDDNQALLQKQSHSFNDSYRVYVGSLAASNAANTGVLAQNSSLVMGELFPQITFTCMLPSSSIAGGPTYVANRMEREWKVTNTAFNQPFNWDVRIDTCALPGFSVGSVNPTNFRLLVDSDGDFSNCAVYQSSSSPIVFSYSNGYVRVTGINNSMIAANSTAYITLGYEPSPITFTGNTQICLGDSSQITVNVANPGPVTFSYSDGTTTFTLNNISNGFTFFVSPTATTTYSILNQANNLSCCGATGSPFITIDVLSTATITATASNNPICLGASTQLTAAGGSTYVWNNGATNGGFVNPTVTTTYTVIGTTSGGCVDTFSVTVQVNSIPTVLATASSDTICVGQSIILSGAGATNYTWNNGVTNNLSFAPSATTTYTVTGTSAGGCSNTASIQIVVNNLPTVLANAINSSICSGATATVFGSGALTYAWNNGVQNNVAFSPTNTAIYIVTGTDANGCQNTNSVQIVVNSAPNVIANASPTSICAGNSTVLSGTGAVSYVWNNGATNGAAVSPAGTTVYTVIGTGSNGCVDTALVTVLVNPLPNVTATATNDTVCAGTTIALGATGAPIYSWTNGVLNNVPFVPTITGFYTVTGTTLNGCQSKDSVFIVVNSLPTVVAIANDSTICLGTSATVFATGASTYAWNNGVQNNVPFSPTATNIYTVIGTNSFGCQNTSSVQILVSSLPVVQVQVNPNASVICFGDSVQLTATGATTYLWSNGQANGSFVTPSATATYTVIGANAFGCLDTASAIVTVNPRPTVSASASNDFFCFGETVTLTGNGATDYIWSNGVQNNVAFTPNTTTTYFLIGTNTFNCFDTTSLTITVFDLPIVQANSSALNLCEGESVLLTATGAASYAWTNGVSNNVNFVPTATTTYTVTGSDANGCSNTDNIQIIVFPLAELELGPDTTICPQDGIILFANQNFDSYSWSNGSTAPSINVSINGTFSLTVEDNNGCIYTDNITITLGESCFKTVYIPTAFSPNGDEHNNSLRTTGDNIDKFEITIFNRWGEVLFISKDINEHWDGTYAGKICPDGVYVYTVKYTTNAGNDDVLQLKGQVSIVR